MLWLGLLIGSVLGACLGFLAAGIVGAVAEIDTPLTSWEQRYGRR
jgi:hypothetical protein